MVSWRTIDSQPPRVFPPEGQHVLSPASMMVSMIDGYLPQLRVATADLVDAIADLSDADVRAPSPLPGWTRGHVLTHLARNADGGTRLLDWARTGVPSYEYESVAARAAAIEEGADRPAAVLVADMRGSADGFFAAGDAVPARAWRRTVRWTTGQETEAALVVPMRLGEVLIHHVDLDIGYRPQDWPAAFVSDYLDRAVTALKGQTTRPWAVRMEATDTGRVDEFGDMTAAPTVKGPEYALLAWLLGRSDGGELSQAGNGRLPRVPPLYTT
jgi:maleylpyruvate isomerase